MRRLYGFIAALMFFSGISLFAEELNWKKIMNNEYKNYCSTMKKRDSPFNIKAIMFSAEEYEIHKKGYSNNVITSKRLYAKFEKATYLNLKKITYSITSSGDLKGYSVKNIFDDSLSTAWAEDDKGFGKGRWVKINLNCIYEHEHKRSGEYAAIRSIVIFPGYGKSEESFYNNNRLKTALLFVSVKDSDFGSDVPDEKGTDVKPEKNLKVFRLNFDDVPKYHEFLIDYPDLAGTQFEFKLYIEDVYRGKKYNDTCISEVQLVW